MNQSPATTTQGTAAYRDRFKGRVAEGHFRESQGLWMSSIGLGSYLGHHDQQTDEAYRAAVKRAAELGCNVFDTAANYRFQRSERSIGDALSELIGPGKFARDEFIVTTKGGYIPFDNEPPRSQREFMAYLEATFIDPGICDWKDFVQGSHCMTPRYLAHQLDQSLRNLKLSAVDVYYIHNPESQFAEVSREEFYRRLRAAFEFLESAVAAGKIAMYGTATWNAYRVTPDNTEFISLEQAVQTAREVAGDNHHFKVVQLPLNIMMIEALALNNQPLRGRQVTPLEAATELGITVMSSASMLQAKLIPHLPSEVSERFKELPTNAQRAIQFTRSTPGLTTALVGMSRVEHVEENMETAKVPPAPLAEYMKLFKQS